MFSKEYVCSSIDPYTCASFFAGVGGIDLGFANTGAFVTVFANEYDTYPAETFKTNFPGTPMTVKDIREVTSSEIPDVDILLAGFCCQPYSMAGLKKGFKDERGKLFFELVRILRETKPRVAFFENVKNLVTINKGRTFAVVCREIEALGYHVTFKIMDSARYGNIAQHRERVYIIAFREQADYDRFIWPDPIQRTSSVRDIINFYDVVDDKFYYRPGKYKGDVYEKLVDATKEDDMDNPSVYQWRRKYVRRNMNHVVPCLTANMGTGGNNVPIVKTSTGIRKMTPRECFNAQGFSDDFILPEGMSDSRLYKQAGNSVCVPVIERIAGNIAKALRGICAM